MTNHRPAPNHLWSWAQHGDPGPLAEAMRAPEPPEPPDEDRPWFDDELLEEKS